MCTVWCVITSASDIGLSTHDPLYIYALLNMTGPFAAFVGVTEQSSYAGAAR